MRTLLTRALLCAVGAAQMTASPIAAADPIDPGRTVATPAVMMHSTDTTTLDAGAPIVSAPADLGDRPADGDVFFVSLTYDPDIGAIGDTFARPATSTIT